MTRNGELIILEFSMPDETSEPQKDTRDVPTGRASILLNGELTKSHVTIEDVHHALGNLSVEAEVVDDKK